MLGEDVVVRDCTEVLVPFTTDALTEAVVEGHADTLRVAFAVRDAVEDPVTVVLTQLDLETDTDADTVDEGETDELEQLVAESTGDTEPVILCDTEDDGEAVVEPVRDVVDDTDEQGDVDLVTLTADSVILVVKDILGETLACMDTDTEPVPEIDTSGDLDTVTELETKAEPDVVEVAARVPESTGDVLLVLHGEDDDDGQADVEPVRDVDGDPDELR